jgi:hypothetical protein
MMLGKKLHNEELHTLYFSPSIVRMTISRKMRWTGYVRCKGERISTCNVLVERSERRSSPAMSTHRWEDNIKINVK